MSTSSYPSTSGSDEQVGAPSSSYRILILGGGEAGLTALQSFEETPLISDVALVEPSAHRYNQAAWMSVGTEGMDKERTRSAEEISVPSGVTWIQTHVAGIDPEARVVTMDDGTTVGYEYLLVSLGTEVNWERIRNLKENLGDDKICSVYGYEQAERTWEMIRNFEGGRALFTAPSTPYKGGNAPLEILRRTEKLWKESGVRDRTELFFTTAARPEIAGEEYAELIERGAEEESIHVYTGYDLIEVRPDCDEAVFRVSKGNSQSQDVLTYDLLHVVPPMRPPAFLEESGLTYRDGPMKGYLEVEPETLRHKRFDTVFGIGDVIGVKGIKTGERAREQAVAVAHRIQDAVG